MTNNNSLGNVCGAVINYKITVRVHTFHLMTAEQHQAAAVAQTWAMRLHCCYHLNPPSPSCAA